MDKQTIAQVAIKVLKEAKQPMTAAEITDAILNGQLYSFNTKDPKSIVRSAIERRCDSLNRKDSTGEKLFRKETDGRYTVLNLAK